MAGVFPGLRKAKVTRNRPLHAGGKVELFRGWDAISRLAPEWNNLFLSHRRPAPCLFWPTLDALRLSGLPNAEPVVAAVHGTGGILALLPLEIRKRRIGLMVRMLGHNIYPWHEPLLDPEVAGSSAAMVLRAVARRLGTGILFDLAGFHPEAPGTIWLQRGLREARGWFPAEGSTEVELNLVRDWPAMQASVSGTLRREARQGLERATRRGGLQLDVSRLTHPEQLEELFALTRSHGGFLETRRGRVLSRFAELSAPCGVLLLATARLQGRLAAGLLVWLVHEQAVELIGAADPGLAPFAPEAALRLALLQHLVQVERAKLLRLPQTEGLQYGLAARPRRLLRFWGSPQQGFLRLTARIAAWYGQEHKPGPALARQWLLWLRTGTARWRARRLRNPVPPV